MEIFLHDHELNEGQVWIGGNVNQGIIEMMS